jgi:beta-phosphoglucomutase-like phosphatase (HAD superfamily)
VIDGAGAVIFDPDGVLLDSEQLRNEAKEALVRASGGRWREP